MSKPWRQAHLGTVSTLQRGYDLPHGERKLGSVPVVTSSGIGDTHSEARVRGPGVVTGRYGTIGQVFVVEEDFWPLNTTLYVKDFHGNDPFFIAHLLRTIDFHSHSGKSGVPGVNRNDLHELIVGIPPLPEQSAIAAALSDVDALLAKLDALIAKKRDLKQAAMQQLLTGQTRLPGFSGEWEVKRIDNFAPLQRGFDLPTSQIRRTNRHRHRPLRHGRRDCRSRSTVRKDPCPQAGHDAGTADREVSVGMSSQPQPTTFYMGWDVGGWNCDKNGKSRDALVILDAELKLIGKPWRGNLRTVINASTDGTDWINQLFGLCKDVLPSRPQITMAIDTPLGFSDALIRLVTRQNHAAR
jgi:hypothetical protein